MDYQDLVVLFTLSILPQAIGLLSRGLLNVLFHELLDYQDLVNALIQELMDYQDLVEYSSHNIIIRINPRAHGLPRSCSIIFDIYELFLSSNYVRIY